MVWTNQGLGQGASHRMSASYATWTSVLQLLTSAGSQAERPLIPPRTQGLKSFQEKAPACPGPSQRVLTVFFTYLTTHNATCHRAEARLVSWEQKEGNGWRGGGQTYSQRKCVIKINTNIPFVPYPGKGKVVDRSRGHLSKAQEYAPPDS